MDGVDLFSIPEVDLDQSVSGYYWDFILPDFHKAHFDENAEVIRIRRAPFEPLALDIAKHPTKAEGIVQSEAL
jgi:hypothetical protein